MAGPEPSSLRSPLKAGAELRAAAFDTLPVMVRVCDARGQPIAANRQWLQMTGLAADGALGPAWQVVLHADDRVRVQSALDAACRDRTAYEVRYRLRRHNGESVMVVERGTPRTDAGGKFAGFVCVVEPLVDPADVGFDDLVGALAHELRSPLNAILGWAELLKTGTLGADEVRAGLEAIGRNARQQGQLISDLVDASRLRSGRQPVLLSPVSLAEALARAIESTRQASAERDIRLIDTRPEHDRAMVAAETDRLERALTQVIRAVVKASPADAVVVVRLTTRGNRVELQVAGRVAAVATVELRSLPDGARKKYAVSLALAREILQKSGGVLELFSMNDVPAMTITLPLVGHAEVPSARESVDEPGPVDLNGLRVLLVDDDDEARDLYARALVTFGAAVATASSVAEALNSLETYRPDVVVTDIAMPGEDGYDLLRKVRKLAPSPMAQVPVAALTAFADAQHRQRALDAGFRVHIPKPIGPRSLAAVVSTLWRDIHHAPAGSPGIARNDH